MFALVWLSWCCFHILLCHWEKRRGPCFFFKDAVHRAITAICYMLETRCLLVAPQESQNSASLHELWFFFDVISLIFISSFIASVYPFFSKQYFQRLYFKPSFTSMRTELQILFLSNLIRVFFCLQPYNVVYTLSKQYTSAVSVLQHWLDGPECPQTHLFWVKMYVATLAGNCTEQAKTTAFYLNHKCSHMNELICNLL